MEITEALAEKPLGIKGLKIFSNLFKIDGVVYIDILITKLFEMVLKKKS